MWAGVADVAMYVTSIRDTIHIRDMTHICICVCTYVYMYIGAGGAAIGAETQFKVLEEVDMYIFSIHTHTGSEKRRIYIFM